jgi:hypothetical protein
MLIPGERLSPAEIDQGRRVAAMTNNDVILVKDGNNQAFDGFQVQGSVFSPQGLIPTELKGLTSANPLRVINEVAQTDEKASGVTLPDGGKLTGVQMFMFAPNMNANAVAAFAGKSPIGDIQRRGRVGNVTVVTGNGTVTVQQGQVTVKCTKTGSDGSCQ